MLAYHKIIILLLTFSTTSKFENHSLLIDHVITVSRLVWAGCGSLLIKESLQEAGTQDKGLGGGQVVYSPVGMVCLGNMNKKELEEIIGTK